MSRLEIKRLKKISHWYDSKEDFDLNLIRFSYLTMKDYFQGESCLELGCSGGMMTELLAKSHKYLDVVDAVPAYIKKVKQRLHNKQHVGYYISLFEKFSLPVRYDDIVMSLILEHVKNPVSILRKYKKHLKPSGRIHIIVPNANSLHRQIGKAMGIIKNLTDFSERDIKLGHRRVYISSRLKRDIYKAGLSIIVEKGVFLKPFSNEQMKNLDCRLLEALFRVGKNLPDICTAIYVCVTKNKSYLK